MKQIDMMRELYRRFNGDEALVVQAYANAERRGTVQRDSNKYGHTPEQYASRLFYNTYKRDGSSK